MQKAFMQIGSALMKAHLRSPLHWGISNTTLLISVMGRKSGCGYTLPVNYVRDSDILYITSTRGRKWWRNLRGGMPVSNPGYYSGEENMLAGALRPPAIYYGTCTL